MKATEKKRLASACLNIEQALIQIREIRTLTVSLPGKSVHVAEVNGEKMAMTITPKQTVLHMDVEAGSIESVTARIAGAMISYLISTNPGDEHVEACALKIEQGTFTLSEDLKNQIVRVVEDLLVTPPRGRPVLLKPALPTFAASEITENHTALPPNADFSEWIRESDVQAGTGFSFVPAEQARGKYRLPRIPGRPVLGKPEKITDKIMVVPYAEQIAKTIHASYAETDGEKLNNVLLYGPSAGGKSIGALIISALLDLPFYGFNIGPNTSEVSLFGGFVPRIKNDGDLYAQRFAEEYREYAQSLSDYDLEISPEEGLRQMGAFQEGEPHADQVLRIKALCAELKNDTSTGTSDTAEQGAYTYALSSFIQCFAYGGVIDLAEGQLAQNQALLGVLNSALSEGYVTLPMSGQIVRRHPNCVIVATGNVGVGHYGAKQLTQSVYSRLTYKVEVPDMGAKELCVIAAQKFGDKIEGRVGSTLSRLSEGFVAMREEINTLLRGDISGTLDARTFFAWIQMAKTMGLKESANYTIIPACSQVRDNQKKITEAVMKKIDDIEDGALIEEA